ncbi:CvpA family protein [Magnetofaba australis]|uniref:Putative colicin V production protein n=1 Tax=Magnetofaba australis IT-1 TaxID=1434232 RepID=A0A1Y2K0F5_9PROT|nr:CvpA family protein [Magnetofaba australis]OSM01442.1 putative colicin V production protein [Magnetofaba australis IT-1]
MIWFDYALLFIFGAALLMAYNRGAIREAAALGGWVIAFALTTFLSGPAAAHLADYIADPLILRAVALFGVLMISLLLTAGISYLLQRLRDSGRLTWKARTLGMSLSLVRAIVIIIVGITASIPFGGPPQEMLRRSVLAKPFVDGALFLAEHQPVDSALRPSDNGRERLHVDGSAPSPWRLSRPFGEAPEAEAAQPTAADNRRLERLMRELNRN